MTRLYGGLIAGVALVGIYLYWVNLTGSIKRLETERTALQETVSTLNHQRDEAIRVSRANAAEVLAIRERADAVLLQISEHYEERLAAKDQSSGIIQEIDHAPQSDDGPIAPVLARALDRLREQAVAP